MVYSGLKLKPGDEVLTTEHDHYATHESLRLSGATVRKVRLYDDPAQATAEAMIDAIKGAITDRTKVLAVTWVHSVSGVKLPIRKLADGARQQPAAARRRRRARARRRARPDRDRVLRRVRRRHAQVARRAARHGPDLVDQGLGPDEPGDPVVRASSPTSRGWRARAVDPIDVREPRRAVHARRLPQLRAPLGARGRVRVAVRPRARQGRGAHPRPRQAPEGRDRATTCGWSRRAAPRSRPGWSASTSTGCEPEDAVERLAEQRIRATVTPYADATSGSAPHCTSTSATWTQPWGLSKRFGGRLTGT